MIGSAETASAVAERLSQPDLAQAALVFDPVMIASSGSVLADDATIGAFRALLDRAMIATPNLPELDALGGEEAVLAHGCSMLVKGGHAEGETRSEERRVGEEGVSQGTARGSAYHVKNKKDRKATESTSNN